MGEDKRGVHIMHMMDAIKNGDLQKVVDLIKDGFEINQYVTFAVESYTALHLSTALKKPDICRTLIDAGADVNTSNESGAGPLMSAAIVGDAEICAMLLAAGANIEAADKDGFTALLYAVHNLNPKTVRLLLEKGANPNRLNALGQAPLHSVSTSLTGALFKREVAEILVSHGADSSVVPENPAKTYLTPFQKAIGDGDMDAVHYFVERCGEDLAQKTVAGKTLVSVAGKRPDMKEYLLSLKSERAVLNAIDGADCAPVDSAKRASLLLL